jgi:hypothetical protein
VAGEHEQKVCDLRGLRERWRVVEQRRERAATLLEVALELGALRADRVGTPKGILALRERARRWRSLWTLRISSRDRATLVDLSARGGQISIHNRCGLVKAAR